MITPYYIEKSFALKKRLWTPPKYNSMWDMSSTAALILRELHYKYRKHYYDDEQLGSLLASGKDIQILALPDHLLNKEIYLEVGMLKLYLVDAWIIKRLMKFYLIPRKFSLISSDYDNDADEVTYDKIIKYRRWFMKCPDAWAIKDDKSL